MEVLAGELLDKEAQSALTSIVEFIKFEGPRPFSEITAEKIVEKLGLELPAAYDFLEKLLAKKYLEKNESSSPAIWTPTILFRARHKSVILEDLNGKQAASPEDTNSSLPSRVAPRPRIVGTIDVYPEAEAKNSDPQKGETKMVQKRVKRGTAAVRVTATVKMLLKKKKEIVVGDVVADTGLTLPTVTFYLRRMERLRYLTVEKKKRPFVWAKTGRLEAEDAGEIGARLSSNGPRPRDLKKETRPQDGVNTGLDHFGEGLDLIERGMKLISEGESLVNEGAALLKKSVPWLQDVSELIKRLKAT